MNPRVELEKAVKAIRQEEQADRITELQDELKKMEEDKKEIVQKS